MRGFSYGKLHLNKRPLAFARDLLFFKISRRIGPDLVFPKIEIHQKSELF